tara:strand:+ start:421 stop:795 length:375 start_codon:yes stop_codon:yes gene_type:complete
MMFIGISSRMDSTGKHFPYLVVVDQDGDIFQSTVQLPGDRKYIQPPVHPLYGDLTQAPKLEQVAHAIKSVTSGTRIITHHDNERSPLLEGLGIDFRDTDISDHGEEAFNQITALRAKTNTKEMA